jgi:hypothetical protein
MVTAPAVGPNVMPLDQIPAPRSSLMFPDAVVSHHACPAVGVPPVQLAPVPSEEFAPPVNVFVDCARADEVVNVKTMATAITRTDGTLVHEVMEPRNLKRGCIIVVPIRLMWQRSAR